jgi:hypothetical protein
MGFDPTNDFSVVVDGLEAVTVLWPGGGSGTTVTHALRRRGVLREAETSDGQATADNVVWHLPTAELPQRPQPGHWVVDACGERFAILQVREDVFASRWRCVTRNLSLAHGLDQYVDIEKAVYSKGAGGADQPAWQLWRSGIAARIQPLDATVAGQEERLATALRVKILVAENLALDHTQRIRAADGAVYSVTGCRAPERIDALQEIDAVRVG